MRGRATALPGDLTRRFAATMAALGPFPPAPRLAAGVSGGADSLALVLLADDWARARGGDVLALIVDHGLRAEAAAEAARTQERLAGLGIASRILAVRDLHPGPALATRARAARFAALTDACARAGRTDLLLGHHRADQAETVLIRALAGSGPDGLAGMAALRELASVRLLRPLLDEAPGTLRQALRGAGIGWVEDPSNESQAAQRARLRRLRADRAGDGPATRALAEAARQAGQARAIRERDIAEWLAAHASLRPEGFALLPAGPFPPGAFSALVQTIAGADFPPPISAIAALAARPHAATLAGARLLPAGRLGPGWILAREAGAMAPPVPALAGAAWDHRFRLLRNGPPGSTFGGLGADAASFRRHCPLPAAILATLPAVRLGAALIAVPHLVPHLGPGDALPVIACPPRPAAVPAFVVAPFVAPPGAGMPATQQG